MNELKRAYSAELLGTAMLLLGVTGSGIMAEGLAAGNTAVALLANSIATGAILFVLVTLAGPISGAHFNPLVTLYCWLTGSLTLRCALIYAALQIFGAVIGVWTAHLIFDLPILQVSQKLRDGPAMMVSEFIAVLTLLTVIALGRLHATRSLPALIAATVTAGYWFTSSTFFANPAVSVARSLTDTFVGIAPSSMPLFCGAQIAGLAVFMMLRKRFH